MSGWKRTMRTVCLIAATVVASCATDNSLVIEQKDDSVTVRVVDGDTVAANRAAQQACAANRKRASLAGFSADRMRFVCTNW